MAQKDRNNSAKGFLCQTRPQGGASQRDASYARKATTHTRGVLNSTLSVGGRSLTTQSEADLK